MQAPERGSNLLNYPSAFKMGTPHKNMNGGSLPPGPQDGEEVGSRVRESVREKWSGREK